MEQSVDLLGASTGDDEDVVRDRVHGSLVLGFSAVYEDRDADFSVVSMGFGSVRGSDGVGHRVSRSLGV